MYNLQYPGTRIVTKAHNVGAGDAGDEVTSPLGWPYMQIFMHADARAPFSWAILLNPSRTC